MYLKLIRERPEGKAVRGALSIVHTEPNGKERLEKLADTLENKDYIIPPLTYRVVVTMSPKFKRLLPILLQVPGRSGIRIHRGTRPEHSLGCILVRPEVEKMLTDRLRAEKSEIRLEIQEL